MKPRIDDVDRHVGAEIKRRRRALDISQQKLGDALGISYQQVHKVEKGINRVPVGRLPAIARALGCRVADLFPPLEPIATPATIELTEVAAGLSHASQRKVNSLARQLARGAPPTET